MLRLIVVLSGMLFHATGLAAHTETSHLISKDEQVFQVTGLVMEVKPEEKSVRIRHDAIPNYMPAMTMWFDVKNTNELAGIEAGHPVSFRMTVTENYGWIDQIRITGPKRNDLPTSGPIRVVRDVEPLEIGDKLPEYTLTNQLGRAFSTEEFAGKVWAINFLFTRCPYPTFCPQTARYFSEAQEKLLAANHSTTNWHLLSISFDPEFDTPEVLRRYSENYGMKPKHWTFATGALIDITAICDQLGLKFGRDEQGGFDHNLRTVVIDRQGRVKKIFVGNEWNPDLLVQEMSTALNQTPSP